MYLIVFYSVFNDVQFSTHVMFYSLFLGCFKTIHMMFFKIFLYYVFFSLCFALDFIFLCSQKKILFFYLHDVFIYLF